MAPNAQRPQAVAKKFLTGTATAGSTGPSHSGPPKERGVSQMGRLRGPLLQAAQVGWFVCRELLRSGAGEGQRGCERQPGKQGQG